MSEHPTLPYPEPGGQEFTSGHSGSDTSRERARQEVDTGIASQRQWEVLRLLGRNTAGLEGLHIRGREEGLTVREVRERTGWHHGQASSTLSVLHKAGKIARLEQSRDRCKVYVLPEYVGARATEPHGGRAKAEVTYSLAEVRNGTGWAPGVRFKVVDRG